MIKTNAENARIKRDYFLYLKEARRYSESSVDCAAKAIARFEADTGYRSFKRFHRQQAVSFKRRLDQERSMKSREPLSRATVYGTLTSLRQFFIWLADKPGFRKRISYSDADYFNLSEKDTQIAKARREGKVPTIEEIKCALTTMPADTPVEMRNRAVMAFALLTGARDSAIASFKLKHVSIEGECVVQDAREVRTKFSKTFATKFFPVGHLPGEILEGWITHLKTDLGWSDDDPLFPATKVTLGHDGRFRREGLERRQWGSADPIRTIFRNAFMCAGLPHFHPHSFRHTLARLGEEICRSPEEFKAWSQNLGHEKVMTTFTSYGTVPFHRQAALIGSMSRSVPDVDKDLELEELLKSYLERKRRSD